MMVKFHKTHISVRFRKNALSMTASFNVRLPSYSNGIYLAIANREIFDINVSYF